MSHVLSFTLEINNFPCLTNFSCRYIHHIRSHAVSGELPIDISGISSHLIGIFGTNDLQGLYHGSVFRLEILELHHSAIVVEGGARYARQNQIRTAAWQVLLHGEGIAVAQVTTQYLVERATNKVLVDLVEYLRRELAEIFLELIFHKRLQLPMIHKQAISGNKTASVIANLIQLVVIIHVDALSGQVGKHHHIIIFQRCHAQVI